METSKTVERLQRAASAASECLQERKAKNAWGRGVNEYAADLLTSLQEITTQDLGRVRGLKLDLAVERLLLNGARDWREFSESGCSLIYDRDICDRVCSPSVAKRCQHGVLPPSSVGTWIDVQARALAEAAQWVVVEVGFYFMIGGGAQ